MLNNNPANGAKTLESNTSNNIWLSQEPRSDIHITTQDIIEVGQDFCKGILLASTTKILSKLWFPPKDRDPTQSPNKKITKDKRSSFSKQLTTQNNLS